ncbi:hypothetical protein PG999_010473 [Apiospora kogelbergensis]|uniref:Uncharacterized protein n=1 Tax=Apiospora kogelbergensis TaxID=1337665 RepID=A0AAW0QLC1_9PEZI
MAYADKMTTAMSPLAIKWYDGVKAHFLAKWPGTLPTLQTLIERVEAPVLEDFYRRSSQPCVSADFFRWSVARATWHELFEQEQTPFPFQGEKPAVFGGPFCEQYACYWYAQVKAERHISGPRTQVGSSSDCTSVQERATLSQRVRPEPMVPAVGCEPLAFPLPNARQPELCLGPRGDLKKTMVEAAAIFGPEFTLTCFHGDQKAHMIVFGLAPGVDANDERVISRARDPIDWLEDWWVNVLEQDTNLLAYLERRMRQRFARPRGDVTGRIAEAMQNLVYGEKSGANMAEQDFTKMILAQERHLDADALRIISQSVAETQGWENRGKELASFIENGHPQVHALEREDRLRVTRGLVHENALAWIHSLVSTIRAAKKNTVQFLDHFIESGSRAAPYVDTIVDRMSVVEEAMRQVQSSDVDFKTLADANNLLLEWKQRLAEHFPVPPTVVFLGRRDSFEL